LIAPNRIGAQGLVSVLVPASVFDYSALTFLKAASLVVPVLGLYGGTDQGIPLDTVEKMRTGLAAGKSGSEILVFPDAPHGFNADYRPSYRKEAAEDAWRRMLDWFKRFGAS
jgi:carboxymethylenebutenolidase